MRRDESGACGADIAGVVVGEVTNTDDPEDLGRVKIRFPWRETNDESYWARIAVPMAGANRGTYFVPEVGDEVLVSFAHGEQRFPYVIGALWNTDQKPPKESDADNDVRLIRSRSGHELVFDDGRDGKVEISTSGGHTVTLDDASGSQTIEIEDSSGQNSVTFDGTTGTLTIEGGTKLELNATNIDISGDGQVKISSSGALTLEGAIIQLN